MRLVEGAELYHSGTVVEDLDRSMGAAEATLGLTWLKPIHSTSIVWTPRGLRELAVVWTYSRSDGHHIELIQHVHGIGEQAQLTLPLTPHLGYWVDNVDESRARLEKLGCPTYFARLSDHDGTSLVSYHSTDFGFYVELVSRSVQPTITAMLSGGAWGGLESSADRPTPTHTDQAS